MNLKIATRFAVLFISITNQNVMAMIVQLGHYPAVTGDHCGLRYVSQKVPLNYSTKCFTNAIIDSSMYDNLFSDINDTTNIGVNTKGQNVDYSEAPYAVFIKYTAFIETDIFDRFVRVATNEDELKSYCSGALINSQWVVTAAHCNLNRTTGGDVYSKIRVFIGDNEHREGGVKVDVLNVSVYRHPKYDKHDQTGHLNPHNIALYKLTKLVDITGTIDGVHYRTNTVCLPQQQPTGHLNSNRETATVYGWGHKAHGVTDWMANTQVLQKADMVLEEDLVKCIGMLCSTKNETNIGQQFCIDDSGAPLVQYTSSDRTKAVLIGVSSGLRCFEDDYRMYLWTPVASNVDWILDTIAKH